MTTIRYHLTRYWFGYAVVLGLVMGAVGCVSLEVPLSDGRTARYSRVGSTSLEGLTVQHGQTHVEVTGYRSEGADLMEAGMRGLGQGLRGGAGMTLGDMGVLP